MEIREQRKLMLEMNKKRRDYEREIPVLIEMMGKDNALKFLLAECYNLNQYRFLMLDKIDQLEKRIEELENKPSDSNIVLNQIEVKVEKTEVNEVTKVIYNELKKRGVKA